jgi:predicted nucleic acid-binding protein
VNNVAVVDTNVVSYIFNQHTLGAAYQTRVQGQILLISAQTLEELRYGAIKAQWGESRRSRLEDFLKTFNTVHTSDAICSACAEIRVQVKQKGFVLDLADAWIAATALELKVPLVTHNAKDFEAIDGLTIITENVT